MHLWRDDDDDDDDDDKDEDVPSKQTRSVVIGEEIPLLRLGCLGAQSLEIYLWLSAGSNDKDERLAYDQEWDETTVGIPNDL